MFNCKSLRMGLAATFVAVGALTASAQEPTPGGDLVLLYQNLPDNMLNAAASGATMHVGAQLFATPVLHDENFVAQPYLAESWSISDDNLSVTLNLRTDAVFHDGTPITSEDVAFSIITIRDNHPFNAMLAPVESVDTPDEHTAIIRMSTPHAAIMAAMGPPFMPIMPKHIYGDGQEIRNHPRGVADVVGSGPFKFVSLEPGNRIVLEKNEDFFMEGRPYVDNIVIIEQADAQSAVLALEQGQADIMVDLSVVDLIQRASENPDLVVTTDSHNGIGALNWVLMNNEIEPFNDVRVRQAIAHALDQDFVVDVLHNGLSKPGGPIHSGFPAYNDEAVVKYEFDLAKAEALLDEAGYPRDDDGVRFRTTIDFFPGLQDAYQRVAEYVKPALKKVGIEVEIRFSADFAAWAKRMSDKTYEMSMDGVFTWGDPVIGNHRTYLSTNIRPAPFTNNSQYQNPEIDDLLNRAASELDLEARNALYAEFQRKISEDVPMVWMTEIPLHSVYRKGVNGFPDSPWGGASPLMNVWKSN